MPSELNEEKITGLESRMDHIEDILVSIGKKLDRIEVGLFGDVEMRVVGAMERIKVLEEQIREVQKVNDNQEISINAKRDLTDFVVLWAKRVFWGGLALLVVKALLSGKMDAIELINIFR